MDDIPVKISERYKPPPTVYQLPQTIVNRLAQQSSQYFNEHPDYNYNFQLERSTIAKVQQWRQMRLQRNDERQERQEQRRREKQRALEAQQREMLGAVQYPSAAELSSDSDDDEKATTGSDAAVDNQLASSINGAESSHNGDDIKKQPTVSTEPQSVNSFNFHTILQPTILSLASTQNTNNTTLHKRNSSLNYADFEYIMNSTPFDNIELKTINDLDVLAQVLHQTQLKTQSETVEQTNLEARTTFEQPNQQLTENSITKDFPKNASLNNQILTSELNDIPATDTDTTTPIRNNYQNLYQTPTTAYSPQEQVYNHNPQKGYNLPQYYQPLSIPALVNPMPNNQSYMFNQAIIKPEIKPYTNGYDAQVQQSCVLEPNAETSKSKSVPDILRELKSDHRRARNNSHTYTESTHLATAYSHSVNAFNDLAEPAKNLAQRISNMGFPLERVAKVVSMRGIDYKKIMEHLIPLGELIDLGFDESKISAALLMFDNNKEKALSHLIN